MASQPERYVIEQGGRGMTYLHRDGFTVYGLGVYPGWSVLAGQQRRRWLDRFDTLEEAQAKYPTAELIGGTSYCPPVLDHLPDNSG